MNSFFGGREKEGGTFEKVGERMKFSDVGKKERWRKEWREGRRKGKKEEEGEKKEEEGEEKAKGGVLKKLC